MGPATAALRPCRKLAKRQGGEERKGRKEEAFLSLSLSLSLSCCRARSIFFCSLCFVLLTKSESVVASFFRRILGSPSPRHFPSPCLHSQFLSSFVLWVCVYWDPCFQESLSSSNTCRNSTGWIPFSSEFSLSISLSVGPIAMSQQ